MKIASRQPRLSMSDTKAPIQAEWLSSDCGSFSDLPMNDEMQKGVEYWKRQLRDVEWLELATYFPRLPVQTYRGGYEEFQISPLLTNKLKELANQQDATLYMVLLGAFKVLL